MFRHGKEAGYDRELVDLYDDVTNAEAVGGVNVAVAQFTVDRDLLEVEV